MGLLRRLFGPAFDDDPPPEAVEVEGHVHAADAHPDDVVVPKRKGKPFAPRPLLPGEPPAGWEQHASKSAGGIWPWSGGDTDGGSFGGVGGGGDGGGGGGH